MSMSDPIADMLTRIRNGSQAKKASVDIPASRTKAAIAEVLKNEGYIDDARVEGDGAKKLLTVDLRYHKGAPVIEKIRRVSRPGCRVYAGCADLPQVSGGLGIALISTSRGIMTDRSAREQNLGGEVLCTVF